MKQIDRRLLFHLVDIVWGDAMEDNSVPSTEHARNLIQKAIERRRGEKYGSKYFNRSFVNAVKPKQHPAMSGEQRTAAAAIVAKKHGLGKNLVTGHKVEYWHEAMDIYANQQSAALKEVIKELIPIAEWGVPGYAHRQWNPGWDGSIVEMKNAHAIIEKARKLQTGSKNEAPDSTDDPENLK